MRHAFHDASEITERLRIEAVEVPRVGLLLAGALASRATQNAGHLRAVMPMLEPVIMVLMAIDEKVGMTYQWQLVLTTAYAMSGSSEKAVGALALVEARRHPSWR